MKLLEGLEIPAPDEPLRVGYYADLDLGAWRRSTSGPDSPPFPRGKHHDPLDIVLALARRFGTVLLNGSGFEGPAWSARVSLANLDADAYLEVGKHLRAVFEVAVDQWKKSTPME